MLRLSKKADYGLIALRHLAQQHPGHGASAHEIAELYGVPLALLAKVLQKLARSGLLRSVPGTKGGYRLARDPHRISALEVVRAIDGPVILTSCSAGLEGCERSARCSVRQPLRRIYDGILGVLAGISIYEIAGDTTGAPGALTTL